MIVDYDVVNEHELPVLTVKVKQYITNGWQPYGDLQVSTPVINDIVVPLYTQVIVKAHH